MQPNIPLMLMAVLAEFSQHIKPVGNAIHYIRFKQLDIRL